MMFEAERVDGEFLGETVTEGEERGRISEFFVRGSMRIGR
jgi:hypothetical protein